MQDGYLSFVYVYTRDTVYSYQSKRRLKAGDQRVEMKITKVGDDAALTRFSVGEYDLGALKLPKMWPIYTPNSGVRCGENRHAPISRAYQAPFVFDQGLKRVVVDIDLG